MRPLTSTFAARQLGAWSVIALGAAVGRFFGPSARGAIESLAALRLGVHAIATLGVPGAATFRVARDPASIGRVASTALGLSLAVGTAAALAVGAWAWSHPSAYAPVGLWAVLVFAASVPPILLTQMEGGVLLGAERIGAWNALTVVNRGLVFPLIALAWFPPLRVVETIVVGLAAAELATAATALAFVRREAPLRVRVDLPLVRELAGYGGVAWVQGMLTWAVLRSDVLLLGALGGTAELGQFAAAGIAREMVFFLPWIAGMLLFPRVAKASAAAGSSSPGESALRGPGTRALPKALGPKGIAVVLGAAVLLFAFAGPFVVGIHGREFAPAAPVVRVLVPSALLMSWGSLLVQEMLGRGAPALTWISPGAAFVVTVVGNLYAIPRYGALGTAWVALAASAVLLAFARVGVARARARDGASPHVS